MMLPIHIAVGGLISNKEENTASEKSKKRLGISWGQVEVGEI